MTAKIVSPRPEGLGIIMVKFVKLIWQLATGAGAAVVATTVVGANPAQAVLLTYDLQGTLIDGGSFVGTFSYDTEEPDLAPGEEFALFLLETWNIQVSSPSLGDFQWSGDVSTLMLLYFSFSMRAMSLWALALALLMRMPRN